MAKAENFSAKYFEGMSKTMQEVDHQEVDKMVNIILEAHQNNKQIFVFGNGGSASTASHFGCDLGKGAAVKGVRRLRIMSLNDNIAHFSAIANDLGYENVFLEQLKNLMNNGDVVIGITVSGNSENIIKAFEYAKEKKAFTVGWIGNKGGKLLKFCDAAVVVSSGDFGLVESLHMILEHLVAHCVRERLEQSVPHQ